MGSQSRFKHVFVLTPGRAGSMSFAQACSFITNYTSGHETRLAMLAEEKLKYPWYHIEVDNRLTWMLGLLARHSENAFFVYLYRSPSKVGASYNKRWHIRHGIMRAYAQGVLMRPVHLNDVEVCTDYAKCVDANIRDFLRDRAHVVIDIDDPGVGFTMFWGAIGAEGDIEAALREFEFSLNRQHFSVGSRMRRFFYLVIRAGSALEARVRGALRK